MHGNLGATNHPIAKTPIPVLKAQLLSLPTTRAAFGTAPNRKTTMMTAAANSAESKIHTVTTSLPFRLSEAIADDSRKDAQLGAQSRSFQSLDAGR